MAGLASYTGVLAKKSAEYRKLGEQEAANHRPPSNAIHPDSNEVTLRSEAEGLTAAEQRIFDSIISGVDKSSLDAQSRITELRADIQQALADNTLSTQIDAELSADRGQLVEVTATRIRREVDWRSFRAANNITEMAHYPESLIWHWGIILSLALVETVVNAFFYENANGLVGGFVVALAVAVVNMGSAAGLGSLFRRRNLAAPDQKYFGWACLILFVPLTFFCNGLFAAFRSSYQTLADPSDPLQLREGFKEAWGEAAKIFYFDIHFQDFSSFLLFMTGIALSMFAFWKGYTSDDPFPGYSKRDRALKAAKADEAAVQGRVKQKLKDFLHAQRTHVQGLAGQTGTLIAMLTRRLSEVEHSQRSAIANASSIERDYHLVLDGYRQANLAVRGTEPPTYFAEKPSTAQAINTDNAPISISEIRTILATLVD
ncbi:hypothetical protein [Sphingobium baderi]|uniref:hypothetical protein n=1 Tax=Sphingobium baderi TaxID=1332080 RepID=UPI002B411507|nr:hypothetical protein [Sphingobium baderi]WRD77194.1 hypothetical protein QQ987_03380 [Sphingobium baderi]